MEEKVEQKPQIPHSFTTITPLSKYLTMALFVLLPFVGFYLGMQYQKYPNTAVQQTNVDISTEDENTSENLSHYKLLDVNPENLTIYTDVTNRFSFQYPNNYGIDYSVFNTDYKKLLTKEVSDNSHDNNHVLEMRNNNAYHDTSYEPEKHEFSFSIEIFEATEDDVDKINKSATYYTNNNIKGVMEIIKAPDGQSPYSIVVSALHDNMLFRFILGGKLVIGRPPQYLPPTEEFQSIFHTILSTFEYQEPNLGHYEDDLISFSYPPDWEINRSKIREEQFNLSVYQNLRENVFTFSPNGESHGEVKFQVDEDLPREVDWQNGTRYTGYGDYSIVQTGSEKYTVGGKTGIRDTYYQKPENPSVGSIHTVVIPVETNLFYTFEYSGPDKSTLNNILNSVVFKN